MFDATIPAKRFKLVRTTYGLSQEILAEIALRVAPISKSALGYWETGKRTPTLDNLQIYSAIFGLSLDWIANVSNVQYTQDSLLYGENNFLEKFGNSSTFSIHYLDENSEFYDCKWDYIFPEQREKNYSLDVRANILVLLRLVTTYPKINRLIFKENMDKEILGDDYTELREKKFWSKISALQKQYQTYHDNLFDLLSKTQTTPLYTISEDT